MKERINVDIEIKELLAKEIMYWETDKETNRWKTRNGLLGKSYWYPSQDISDAWMLMEQFEESLLRRRMNGLNYRAWIKVNEKEYSAIAETSPEAIVKVMMKYLGRED